MNFKRILIGTLCKVVTEDELKPNLVDLDFGNIALRIEREEGKSWKVTNAVNGYGQNIKHQFINTCVEILPSKSFSYEQIEDICTRLMKSSPETSGTLQDLLTQLKL